jgi:hypothetical protein
MGRDDELSSLTGATHDLSVLVPILRSAYVAVGLSPQPITFDFTRNLIDTKQKTLAGATPNSTRFWSVPLLLAFDPDIGSDNDPTTRWTEKDIPSMGRTSPFDQPLAAVFTETNRDLHETASFNVFNFSAGVVTGPQHYRETSAHEVLHAMTLVHNGGIMCAIRELDAADPLHANITEKQRTLIRQVDKPFAHRLVNEFSDANFFCDLVTDQVNCCPRLQQ